jgi:hypothetical protein
LSLTCHACDQTLAAETEEELVELGVAHAATHGHEPPQEHVLARVRQHNKPA